MGLKQPCVATRVLRTKDKRLLWGYSKLLVLVLLWAQSRHSLRIAPRSAVGRSCRSTPRAECGRSLRSAPGTAMRDEPDLCICSKCKCRKASRAQYDPFGCAAHFTEALVQAVRSRLIANRLISPGRMLKTVQKCFNQSAMPLRSTTSYAEEGSKPSNNADAALISRCICSRNNVTRFVLRKSR